MAWCPHPPNGGSSSLQHVLLSLLWPHGPKWLLELLPSRLWAEAEFSTVSSLPGAGAFGHSWLWQKLGTAGLKLDTWPHLLTVTEGTGEY